ncbi:MAG: tetratricopeptide repeat protein [Sedimenticola sp.]
MHRLFPFLVILSGLAYLPGLDGPYLFDDYSSIVNNSYIQITDLSVESLYNAAFSTNTGPLRRPLANLTFALNYYISGHSLAPFSFKLTNLIIHITNGLFVFVFVLFIQRHLTSRRHNIPTTDLKAPTQPLSAVNLAGITALLWVLSPIMLTSVLYVVQRMTSLSTLFTLCALTCYLQLRTNASNMGRVKQSAIAATLIISFAFGLFSKESAILLPLFIITLEYFIFSDCRPWSRWSELSSKQRGIAVAGLAVISTGLLLFVIQYATPGYSYREFSMVERLLTESRVILLYLSLILLPHINDFALYHDEIAISTSLLNPATTLAALIAIALLLTFAIRLRKTMPLLAFGVVWFFVGHLLESTFLPLEIIHEHRNYLPALGLIIAAVDLLNRLSISHRQLYFLFLLIGIVFGGTTLLRATQWSSAYTLASYEAQHHPNSPSAMAMLAAAAKANGDLSIAIESTTQAARLAPKEPAHLIRAQLFESLADITPSKEVHKRIIELISQDHISAKTRIALKSVVNQACNKESCVPLTNHLREWLTILININSQKHYRSLYYYLLGKSLITTGHYNDALQAFNRSQMDDKHYLQPLFEMLNIYISANKVREAKALLELIRERNIDNPHPRDKEITLISQTVRRLELAGQ